MTNEPTKQGNKYLRGEVHTEDDTMNDASPTKTSLSSVTSAPNEILESYLEQRLKKEASQQKNSEQKEEAQELIQMLRKAYLKQLVTSLKDEEVAEKDKSSRQLDTSSSPFARLMGSSIENLLGSRESRSIEHKNVGEEARETTQNLIRDLLINEVFTSARRSQPDNLEEEQSTSTKAAPESLDNIDTAEVVSITERVLSLSSTEREELVKGLDELGQEQEETAINKPFASSTENSIGSIEDKRRPAREVIDRRLPAHWIPIPVDTGSDDMSPFGTRVRRQTLLPEVAAVPSADEQQQIQTFIDDIRKFFTLLSALDQDQCLQKLVCDVHTNEKDISTLTQYETNILTTFK